MRENVWKNYNEKEKEELEKLCADYMKFFSHKNPPFLL